jgi:hypothetical protein
MFSEEADMIYFLMILTGYAFRGGWYDLFFDETDRIIF